MARTTKPTIRTGRMTTFVMALVMVLITGVLAVANFIGMSESGAFILMESIGLLGAGVMLLLEGSVPSGGHRKGGVEMYDRKRFFTMTGLHVDGTPQTVEERRDAVRSVHAESIIVDETEDGENGSQPPQTQITLDDEELLEKAVNAANGEKFRQLWIGDTSGYKSHSEADQALCNFLAFWCGGDEAQMERLFNQSGLTREKWRNRPDYRERTIREAVKGMTDYFEPAGGD